ncbi:MAG: hypothetical protein ABI583_09165, partial [Betaproteobacteria bacterium]
LVCNKGKPEICLQDQTESCDIESCILQHETKHIEDIAAERIDVCDSREDGQLAQTPKARKVVLERSAIIVEQTCLRLLLRQSQGDCRRRVMERIKRVAKFDIGCVQGAETCVSPLLPFNPAELVNFCTW